ncbi:uncharacterized protein LAJ45_01234 [Morchella importuna]|uniref:uncharacterized protein n=1 Tax=Morchella importuna TaxID=1174673 RepID=UPI001E8DAFF5|nr:uncharacterized protein LAJ45_01234 [Morchella importuna]KAH8154703.1 hypothetical protein LAJ45_01234 [Morchella importuna]
MSIDLNTTGPQDTEITSITRFLFRPTSRGLPLELPRHSEADITATSDSTNSLLPGVTSLDRSHVVLDALVSISVSGSKQCLPLSLAIGLTIVGICLAENNRKPQKGIKEHLESIWQQLNTIAALQRCLRCENSLPDSNDSKGTSLKDAGSCLSKESTGYKSLKELKQTLNRDIHRFCYFKTKHRVKKYLGGIPAFCKYYKANSLMLDVGDVLMMVIYYLDQIYQVVMKTKVPLDSAGIPYLDWDHLVSWFNLLIREYTNNMTGSMDRTRYIMATWSSLPEVKNDRTLNQFDLARALQKLVTLSSHIQDLINFAYSPRLRSILEKKLEVVLVDPIVDPVPEPSLGEMKCTVQHAFAMTEYAKDLCALGKTGETALQASLNRQLDLVEGALGSPVPFTPDSPPPRIPSATP